MRVQQCQQWLLILFRIVLVIDNLFCIATVPKCIGRRKHMNDAEKHACMQICSWASSIIYFECTECYN
jgi:hypothetical protein